MPSKARKGEMNFELEQEQQERRPAMEKEEVGHWRKQLLKSLQDGMDKWNKSERKYPEISESDEEINWDEDEVDEDEVDKSEAKYISDEDEKSLRIGMDKLKQKFRQMDKVDSKKWLVNWQELEEGRDFLQTTPAEYEDAQAGRDFLQSTPAEYEDEQAGRDFLQSTPAEYEDKQAGRDFPQSTPGMADAKIVQELEEGREQRCYSLEGRLWNSVTIDDPDRLKNEAASVWGDYEIYREDPWFDDEPWSRNNRDQLRRANSLNSSDRLRRINSLESLVQPRVPRGWKRGGRRPRKHMLRRPLAKDRYITKEERRSHLLRGKCECWKDIVFLDDDRLSDEAVSVWGNYESHGKDPWFDDDACFEEIPNQLRRVKSLNSIEQPRVRRGWKRVGGRPRERRIKRPSTRHKYECIKECERRCREGRCECWQNIFFRGFPRLPDEAVSVWGDYESQRKDPWSEEDYDQLRRTKSLNSTMLPGVPSSRRRVVGRPRESKIVRPKSRHQKWLMDDSSMDDSSSIEEGSRASDGTMDDSSSIEEGSDSSSIEEGSWASDGTMDDSSSTEEGS